VLPYAFLDYVSSGAWVLPKIYVVAMGEFNMLPLWALPHRHMPAWAMSALVCSHL
jgi:hypothetical protein